MGATPALKWRTVASMVPSRLKTAARNRHRITQKLFMFQAGVKGARSFFHAEVSFRPLRRISPAEAG